MKSLILSALESSEKKEIDYNRLSSIDNPQKFMIYVLLRTKDNLSIYENHKFKKYDKKYNVYENEKMYLINLYINWGMMEIKNPVYPRPNDWKPIYELTQKGIDALKWGEIQMFEPSFWSENKKFILTWIIQFITLLLSVWAFIK